MIYHPEQILHNSQHATETLRAEATQHQMIKRAQDTVGRPQAPKGSLLIQWMRWVSLRMPIFNGYEHR